MSSIRKVAEHAGVSIATVSRVINGADSVAPALRRRVLSSVDSCNYKPTTGRRTLESIGLIYAGPFTVSSPYDSACLDGMMEEIRESAYDLTILDVHRDKSPQETLSQFFARKGIKGAVIRSTAADRGTLKSWATEGLPLLGLGDHFDCPGLSFVYAPSESASREAVEHLVSLGHKRIAFAACLRDDGDHIDRLNAYRAVMDANGLRDESLEHRVPTHRFDGMQLLRNLLGAKNRPTAIYIADPLVAAGAVNEAHRLGVKIPDDLSIIGFDDTDTRNSVFPSMTAVCQDSTQLGRDVMRALLNKISDDNSSLAPTHQAWLEIGNTSGPAPLRPQRVLPSGTRLG